MRIGLDKLKAIWGTSIAGGAIGALLSSVVLGVGIVVSPGEVTPGLFLGGAALMGGFGAFTAAGFATALALSKGRGGLEGLSVLKSAAIGLLAGALFPTAAALLTAGYLVPLEFGQLAFLGGVFGTLGAGVTAGLTAVAKDADPQIEAPLEPEGLIEP